MKTQKAIIASFFESFPDFASERKSGKAHNDYSTDCRCAFVDYVDALAKNGDISPAIAQNVTLGRGNKSTPKVVRQGKGGKLAQNEVIQRYIMDAINLEDYPASDLPAILQVREMWRSEYCYPENVARYKTDQRLFIEWVMGLPTCLSVDFYYTEQRDLLKAWGIPAPADDWAMSQKFYAVIYMQFVALVSMHEKANQQ